MPFRRYGYAVEVLHRGARGEMEGGEVRALMESGGGWRPFAPPSVVRVLDRLTGGEV